MFSLRPCSYLPFFKTETRMGQFRTGKKPCIYRSLVSSELVLTGVDCSLSAPCVLYTEQNRANKLRHDYVTKNVSAACTSSTQDKSITEKSLRIGCLLLEIYILLTKPTADEPPITGKANTQ